MELPRADVYVGAVEGEGQGESRTGSVRALVKVPRLAKVCTFNVSLLRTLMLNLRRLHTVSGACHCSSYCRSTQSATHAHFSNRPLLRNCKGTYQEGGSIFTITITPVRSP